ncbi:MAG: hypothetical protein LUC88_10320 [Prevotella sp.]|nr:hypothetical protein [Prevotella sp.]
MKNKDFNYNKKFSYSDQQDNYTIQIKKRNLKWLWLLLLLPLLLLLVNCERDITVHTRDAVSKEDIPYVNTSIDYTAHHLYKDGSFFVNEKIHREIQTDDRGKGVFEKLPCSVFSYIFYAFSHAAFTTTEDCYTQEKTPDKSLFHYTWNKTIKMKPKTADLELSVVDRETAEPVAGATVIYEYNLSGTDVKDSLQTTPAGTCTIKGVPQCGDVMLSKVYCYGYADTTNVQMHVPTVLANTDSAVVKLTPLKQSFSYFVKNKYTKEPIPGATVDVTLTTSNGNVLRGRSTTNVDGKGLGVYEDAFVLANVDLKASKTHYKDGYLEKQYTVDKFAVLPDDERTVYLEPEPYMEQFQNVDSVTNLPIAGVTNEIQINSISGKTETLTETSNRNGVFYIKAMEGDKIEINSELANYYVPKKTTIKSFSKGEIIKMQPKTTDLTFRTIDGETGELLPECTLQITTSVSNVTQPVSSGNGMFTVKNVFVGENISITASKAEYTTNSTTVRNARVIDLMNASQERRDIPLNVNLPPCDAGSQAEKNLSAGTVSPPKSYNMGVKQGTFTITYSTGDSCSDCIDIYNHNPGENPYSGKKVFSSGQVVTDGDRRATVSFSNGSVITVIVTTGPDDGSDWSYYIGCPNP